MTGHAVFCPISIFTVKTSGISIQMTPGGEPGSQLESSSGIIWAHLGSPGLLWAHLGSSGLMWAHLGSSGLSGLIWAHLGSSGLLCAPLLHHRRWQLPSGCLRQAEADVDGCLAMNLTVRVQSEADDPFRRPTGEEETVRSHDIPNKTAPIPLPNVQALLNTRGRPRAP